MSKARPQGFEPRPTGLESVMLPLHQGRVLFDRVFVLRLVDWTRWGQLGSQKFTIYEKREPFGEGVSVFFGVTEQAIGFFNIGHVRFVVERNLIALNLPNRVGK